MSFPQTRLTLIQRLASEGSEADWRSFLKDYWGPVCRFAVDRGARDLSDAEDVSSETFVILWESRLLVRWVAQRSAKLRTLLCAVVKNILANRSRKKSGRERLLADPALFDDDPRRIAGDDADAFYAIWVEDLVGRAVESLAADYYQSGKGDYIRVLYGRLCERLSIGQTAELLKIAPATVDNYYRHAREKLSVALAGLVRRQVERYVPPEEAAAEFELEWGQLGSFLARQGGLEEAVRRAYSMLEPAQSKRGRSVALTQAVNRLTDVIRAESAGTPPKV